MNKPETPDGIAAWGVFKCLSGQVRTASTRAGAVLIGLDFSAAFLLADRMGVESLLFTELLPEIEACIVRGFNDSSAAAADADESDL